MAIKLTTLSFQEILDARNSQHICIEKGIAKEDIVVKNLTVDTKSLTIKGSKFKKCLTFHKCKFSGDVIISNTAIDKSISFLDCEISGDLKIFQPKIQNSMDIIHSTVNGLVLLEDIEVYEVNIATSNMKQIEIRAADLSNKVSNIIIQKTNIEQSAKIEKIEKLQKLIINEVTVPFFENKLINSPDQDKVKIDINYVTIENLSLEKIYFSKNSLLTINQSKFNNLNIRNSSFISSKTLLKESLISSLLVIDGIKQKESSFDISTSTILNLKLDLIFLDFIFDSRRDAILLQKKDMVQRGKTLLILKNYFASEHLYYAEDKCFYMLKNEEKKYFLAEKKPISKIFSTLNYVTNRFLFGWGVKISNPVISTIFIIIIFAIYFYFRLGLYNPSIHIAYLNESLSGLSGALVISMVSFLGQYSDIRFPAEIHNFIFISEYIIGMILTTIIVGIIIRKLVR